MQRMQNKKVKNYNKMLNSAYFARIDFEDSEGTLPIYIGISSLQQNEEFYVYDWRAPISSMFYNSEIGDASFTIATGEKVSGKLHLKDNIKLLVEKLKKFLIQIFKLLTVCLNSFCLQMQIAK